MTHPQSLPELPEPQTLIIESDVGHRAFTAWQMRAYALAAVEAEVESITDAICDALQSDLEHGVKWLNENASLIFKKGYPALFKALEEISSRTKEST
jgi:hypothetical protein